MNPEITGQAKITTSIQIPRWLAVQIKQDGHTYAGIMVRGWNALQDVQKAHQQLSDLQAEYRMFSRQMQKYKDYFMEHEMEQFKEKK